MNMLRPTVTCTRVATTGQRALLWLVQACALQPPRGCSKCGRPCGVASPPTCTYQTDLTNITNAQQSTPKDVSHLHAAMKAWFSGWSALRFKPETIIQHTTSIWQVWALGKKDVLLIQQVYDNGGCTFES